MEKLSEDLIDQVRIDQAELEEMLNSRLSLKSRFARLLHSFRTLWRGRNAMLALLKWKIDGNRRTPVRVSLLVTKKCNLRCFYCYTLDEITDPEVKDKDTNKIIKLIDELYDAGCRWINVLGGEPLVRNDIDTIVDHIISKGILCEMTTNGYFIKKRLETLKKIDHLAISLDGDRFANDMARIDSRGKGSFDQIVDGIRTAATAGLPIRVHATLNKRTMSQQSLVFLSRLCNAFGMTFNYSENGLPDIENLNPDFLLAPGEEEEFYDKYDEFKKKGYPIVSSDFAMSFVKKWPLLGKTMITIGDLNNIPKDSFFPCTLGRNQCFVAASGNVYPCTKKWGYGLNVYEVGFEAAWTHLDCMDCVACKELGTIEQSVITSLNPRGFAEALRNFVFHRR
jgi:sulfatase maturation enzyme AslB (radical SAM superfamily)